MDKELKEKADIESFECFYNRFLREHPDDTDIRSAMFWGWITRKCHEDSLETMKRLGIGS